MRDDPGTQQGSQGNRSCSQAVPHCNLWISGSTTTVGKAGAIPGAVRAGLELAQRRKGGEESKSAQDSPQEERKHHPLIVARRNLERYQCSTEITSPFSPVPHTALILLVILRIN